MMGTFGEQIDITSAAYRQIADDAVIIVQAVFMILTTEEGTYFEAPETGFALEEMLGSAMTPEDVARFASKMSTAIEQDERIERADVTLSTSPGPSVRVRFAVDVTPVDGSTVPLTVDVLDGTVDVQLRSA